MLTVARQGYPKRVLESKDIRAVAGGAMIDRRTFSTTLIAGVATSLLGRSSKAQAQPPVSARNVVLVHGAYADGSCWSEVIGRLQLVGLKATAVQNPLTSLADDVAATRRILALQDGPTVLVGHSWAGTVILRSSSPMLGPLVQRREVRGERRDVGRRELCAAHRRHYASVLLRVGNALSDRPGDGGKAAVAPQPFALREVGPERRALRVGAVTSDARVGVKETVALGRPDTLGRGPGR